MLFFLEFATEKSQARLAGVGWWGAMASPKPAKLQIPINCQMYVILLDRCMIGGPVLFIVEGDPLIFQQ